jgi:hypothetical protein
MNAYRRQLDDFVQIATGRREPEPQQTQVALMRLLEAAYRAAEAGCEIEL